MKKIPIILVLLLSTAIGFTQTGVGIGTAAVNSNAVVDMSKSNRGLLMPRLTQFGRLFISSPAEALMLYDTTFDRTYLYIDGLWRYLLNSTFWLRSSTPNTKYIYSFDSVGIGATSPDARLEVNGNIRIRSSLLVDNDVKAANFLKGNNLTTNGNVSITGSAAVSDNIITQSSVVVDDATPIVQLKSGGVNKAFMQADGDDFRIGTNSGNTTGKTIIRMNGTDIISIDTSSGFKVLIGGSGGNIDVGYKVVRLLAPNENMLPELYGKVYGNNSQVWMSTNGTILNTGTGTYEVDSFSARVSARASILVTVAGSLPLTASAIYVCCGVKIKIQITNPLTGALTNADFGFIVMEPLNIYD